MKDLFLIYNLLSLYVNIFNIVMIFRIEMRMHGNVC